MGWFQAHQRRAVSHRGPRGPGPYVGSSRCGGGGGEVPGPGLVSQRIAAAQLGSRGRASSLACAGRLARFSAFPNGKYLGKFLWKCCHVLAFYFAPPHGHDSAPDSESWSHTKITRPLFNATANQKTRFLLLISRLGDTKTSSPDFVTLSASENKGGAASGAKPWRSFDLEREREGRKRASSGPCC